MMKLIAPGLFFNIAARLAARSSKTPNEYI